MRTTLSFLTLLALGTSTGHATAVPARSTNADASAAMSMAGAGAVPKPRAKKSGAPLGALSGDERIVHALNRLGFGPRPGDVEKVRAQGLGSWIDAQLHPEKIDDSAFEASLKSLPVLDAAPAALAAAQEYDTARAIKLLRAMQTANNSAPDSARAQKARAQLQRASKSGERGAKAASAPDMAVAGSMSGVMAKAAGANENASQSQDAAGEFAVLPALQQERAREVSQRAEAAGMEPGDSVRAVGALAAAKIARAAQSERQLQEVLVDFWSNHFNLDVRKGAVRTLKVVDEREVIRPRVLGKFRDLLGASAHSPAMLVYLDNVRSSVPIAPRVGRRARLMQAANQAVQAKARGGVNENYARELMELHTLGVGGGYTQADVQEVARCFTGWSLDRDTGEFRFNARAHDNGAKSVLGHAIAPGGGEKDGEQVLDILAAHPSTAKFLARKLCERLASDEPPQVLVERATKKWMETGGDLRAVVAEIVYSPQFFDKSIAGSKIKSPFEFAVSCVRALDANIALPDMRDAYGAARVRLDGQSILYASRARGAGGLRRTSMSQSIAAMGQPLFAYQAPTGYPGDSRRWVSSGALIARLNFALALAQGQVAQVQMPAKSVLDGLSGDDHEAVLARLNERLLSGAMTPATRATLLKQLKPGTPADAVKLTALVLGAPEFQRR
jgi:uncharacterized protein (DUF1800 family)